MLAMCQGLSVEIRQRQAADPCLFAWRYDLCGKLVGVAFRNGAKGEGGTLTEFGPANNGLRVLSVEVFNGLVFNNFQHGLKSVAEDWGLRSPVGSGRFLITRSRCWATPPRCCVITRSSMLRT